MFRQTIERVLRRTAGTSSHGTEQRIDMFVSLTSCTKRRLSPTLSMTKCSMRGMVLTTRCVVARLHFEKEPTSCNVCATPSGRDKSKRPLSQLIDVSMLHDERCTRVPLASPWTSKLMTYSMHFAILPYEPSVVLAQFRALDFKTHVEIVQFGRSHPQVHAQCQETFQNLFHGCCFLQVAVVVLRPFLTS